MWTVLNALENNALKKAVSIIATVPDGAVVNDEQVNLAGSGIQLPLLWHVTLRVCLSVKVSFSQVNIKTDPSRVEL